MQNLNSLIGLLHLQIVCQNFAQKFPKVAQSCQKLPKVAKSCQKLPKVANSCQNLAQNCQLLIIILIAAHSLFQVKRFEQKICQPRPEPETQPELHPDPSGCGRLDEVFVPAFLLHITELAFALQSGHASAVINMEHAGNDDTRCLS
jgi:hypothetical protein